MMHEVRNENKQEEPQDEEYENDSSETQRMNRLHKNWERPPILLKENMRIYSKRKLVEQKLRL